MIIQKLSSTPEISEYYPKFFYEILVYFLRANLNTTYGV